MGLIDLFQDGKVDKLDRIADLLIGPDHQDYLSTNMTGMPLKSHLASLKPSGQQTNSELMFNHEKQIDFKAFAWELLTRQHSADALLFANLFMDEQERGKLLRAYSQQAQYTERGSPLFTMITVLTGEPAEDLAWDELLPNWRLHCAFVLKSLAQAQTRTAKAKVKDFLGSVAEKLLIKYSDVPSYLALSILTDSFKFDLLQEHSRTNLMNVDLRVNYLMSLVSKLRRKHSTDPVRYNAALGHLVACAFYRAICYGQVL